MILQANAGKIPLAAESVDCCVCSPPYWGLRKYGEWNQQQLWGDRNNFQLPRKAKERKRWFIDMQVRAALNDGIFSQNKDSWFGAYGLEPTPEEYVENMVQVFREVRRVLKQEGSLWLNLGDTMDTKQLQGIPWRVAFALQADG